jgi:hypothetical protein
MNFTAENQYSSMKMKKLHNSHSIRESSVVGLSRNPSKELYSSGGTSLLLDGVSVSDVGKDNGLSESYSSWELF